MPIPTLEEQRDMDALISRAIVNAENAKGDLTRTYFIKRSAVEYFLHGTPLTPEAKAFIAKWA